MIFNFRRFRSIFMARNKEFYRDIGALAWTFIFPLFIIIGFSYMFKLNEEGLYKVAYIKPQAMTSAGAKIKQLLANPDFSQIKFVESQTLDEGMTKLNHHQIDLLVSFTTAPHQVWTNSSSPKSHIAEKLFITHFYQKSAAYPDELQRKEISQKGISYIDWLFPGLLTMNVMWMALWGVGWIIVRQRKLGILKRFKASPLTALEYLLAQMSSRLFLLFTTGILLFSLSHLIHPFQTLGSYVDLLIFYLLGSFALSSVGLLVAARISSDELANGLLNMLSFPMMFLSEIWFSLEGSPEWVRYLAKCLPLWHMTDSMRKVMNEGYTLAQLQEPFWMLIGMSVIFTSIGAATFKWTS